MEQPIAAIKVKTVKLEDFLAMLDAQGVPRDHIAFRCPMCGTIQSGYDLMVATGKNSFDSIAKELGFSCLGKLPSAATCRPKKQQISCNWNLENVLYTPRFAVQMEDGQLEPHFEPCSRKEAVQHMRENLLEDR